MSFGASDACEPWYSVCGVSSGCAEEADCELLLAGGSGVDML